MKPARMAARRAQGERDPAPREQAVGRGDPPGFRIAAAGIYGILENLFSIHFPDWTSPLGHL